MKPHKASIQGVQALITASYDDIIDGAYDVERCMQQWVRNASLNDCMVLLMMVDELPDPAKVARIDAPDDDPTQGYQRQIKAAAGLALLQLLVQDI